MGWTSALAASGLAATAPAVVEAAIDLSYLARFTLGNASLEREVLELFAAQAPLYLARLRTAATPADWQLAAHTIKGAAAAVGARHLQRFAELAERVDAAAADRQVERASALEAIGEATEAACRQIQEMFGDQRLAAQRA